MHPSHKPEAAASPALRSEIDRSLRWRMTASASWVRFRNAWRVFARNHLALLGLVMLALFGTMPVTHKVLLATIWPQRVYDTVTGFDTQVVHPSAPSKEHLLGTDAIGRDVLSLLLGGATPAFVIGLTAALTSAVISTAVGAASAYYGRGTDAVFTHISDALLLLPAPLLMVILAGRFSSELGPLQFGLIYGLLAGFGGATIVMRAHALTVMRQPYIEAARIAGAGADRIIFYHLVPHMLPLAAAYAMTTVTGAIVADGFASFFALNRGYVNWGSMVYAGLYYRTINPAIPWNLLIPPGVALSLFVASFYLISRGLHEVAEPRLRRDRSRVG